MSSRCSESFYKLLDSNDVCSACHKQFDHLRHKKTGLVHCVLTRLKPTPSKLFNQSTCLSYNFAVEMPATFGEGITQNILTGVQDSKNSYTIYSIPTDASQGHGYNIGSLVRVQMNMYSISYVLKNASNVSISYIVYHVPSPIKLLLGAHSRFAELAIYHLASKSDTTDDHYLSDAVKNLKINRASPSTYFDEVCMNSISRHHNLSGLNAIQNVDISIHVMQSKIPYISSSSGNATLNFRGRGKYASKKNMQLVSTTCQPTKSENETNANTAAADNDEKINIQMCKWDADTYHIDYNASPYISHLHAFAFGLAQIHL